VARLEARLGARLFERTTRQVTLTAAGKHLLDATAAALDRLETAEAEVRESAQVLAGPLRVSLPLELGEEVVVPLIIQFAVTHPKVRFQVDLSNNKVNLHDGLYDIAVRGGVLPDSGLHARRLRGFRLRTVASPSYIQHNGRPTTPDDLSQHACLIYTRNTRPGRWEFNGADGHTRSVPIEGPMRSNSPRSLVQAAKAGLGITRQPDFLVDPHVASGALIDLSADWHGTEHAFFAVVPSRAMMPARLRAFLDHLAQHL